MAVKMKDADKDQLLLGIVQQSVAEIMKELNVITYDSGNEDKQLKKIHNIMTQFGYTVNEILPPFLIEDYFGGVDEATRMLAESGEGTFRSAFTDEGKISQPFQKVIHLKAVENLIDDSMLDIAAAVANAKASSVETIKETLDEVRGLLAKGLILGDPRNVTKQKLMTEFRNRGMTSFRTSDGKNLPLDFYSMTVARTKSRTATVQGSTNRYIDAGQDLVEIVGNGDSCKTCSAHQGMVLSLTGKTRNYPVVGTGDYRLPPFHPNCRCSIRLWDYNNKTAKERKDAIQRRKEFDPTKDRRSPEQIAQYKQEQDLRRKANAEKKQFMRWTDSLGAEAPKNLAAFRRMKRQNTVQFQLLQSEYRSRAMYGAVRRTPPAPLSPLERADRFATPAARKRFDEITVGSVPMDMSTNSTRKKYAKDILQRAGLDHVSVSVKKLEGYNGAVTYRPRVTDERFMLRLEVSDFELKSNDARDDQYKLKTLFHEFYHANYRGLRVNNKISDLTPEIQTSLEETATETASHYMALRRGADAMTIPSYPKYLRENLPRLKKLPEFQECESIEDFGAVFMKYRFDDNHKTADWSSLNDQLKVLDSFDVREYTRLNYDGYIQNNMDTVIKQVAASFDKDYPNNPRMLDVVKKQINDAIDQEGYTTSYDAAVVYAMKVIGVKLP